MKEISSYVESSSDYGEDCVGIANSGNAILLCVADGAGGTSGGKMAAEIMVESISYLGVLEGFSSPDDFESFLRKLDQDIYETKDAGETTAIIGLITSNTIFGASIGDSECWMFSSDFDYELTKHQKRKPLLGSGSAIPIGFGPMELSGPLVLGTDGLFKYANFQKIKSMLTQGTAKDIITLAKEETGQLQDDAAVIICK